MKARDWLAIFKQAAGNNRHSGPDKVTLDSLTRAGLAVTRRSAFLYNLGRAPAILFLVALIATLLSVRTQDLAHLPFSLRALGAVAPMAVSGLLFLAVRRSEPALALGLRHSLLYSALTYFPWYLLLSLTLSARQYDSQHSDPARIVYGSGGVDWIGLTGWGAAALTYPLLIFYLLRAKAREKNAAAQGVPQTPQQKQAAARRMVIFIVSILYTALTLMTLTAHHGRGFSYLLSFLHQ